MNSASTALLLSCKVIGIKKGDIVWVPTNTYAATANCALELGANIEFIDVDKDNLNISLDELRGNLLKQKNSKITQINHTSTFCGTTSRYGKIKQFKKNTIFL